MSGVKNENRYQGKNVMKLNVYAIFDNAARAYLPPFFLLRDTMAIRSFTEAVNSKDHPLNKFPQDYSLFRLGSFDDSSGQIDNESPQPAFLISGLVVLEAPAPKPEHFRIEDQA
ncbi:MAG: hypothetical protein [Microvirus sp.]|nr:MAG: hypothetical protein [Microvirus sp.]